MFDFSTSFWDVLVWSFWFFIWVSAVFVWVRCIFDVFSDHTLSGWGKAGWAALLIFLPWLGALIYLIVRGNSMSQRQVDAMKRAEAEHAAYVKRVAGGMSAPEQISHAKSLLDSGAITQAEFETLKAKALS